MLKEKCFKRSINKINRKHGYLDKNYIYLQDPEIAGIRKIKRADFKRVWFDFEGYFMRTKNDLILRRLIVIAKK
jgi:predicted double-glycine peptidase